jgi:NTE family protein
MRRFIANPLRRSVAHGDTEAKTGGWRGAITRGVAAAAQGSKNMVFWARAASAPDAVGASELEAQLQRFALTRDSGPRAIKALVAEAAWFSLPGGMILPREGDNDEAVFLVISGALGVYANDESEADRFVAHIPAGETVGEMSLLTGESHSATLVALRDTQLLRLSKPSFEKLLARHPRLSLNMMRILVRRLRHTTRRGFKYAKARTLALVPLHPGVDVQGLASRLQTAFASFSMRCTTVRPSESGRSAEWFYNLEKEQDLAIYAGDAPNGAWTQFCIRQADRVLLIAADGEPIPSHPFAGLPAGQVKRQMPELVVLRAADKPALYPEITAQAASAYSLHHFICPNTAKDVERLARLLTGRAVGLVLAGGGARGFAHIGIIRALREAGVPFDMTAGASMGAIIAACVARGWSDQEIHARMRRAFVETNPLSDFTLPLVSVFRGQKVSRMLQENFGDLRIEEMRLPFFCTSSDLTHGRTHVHRTGPVWRALRASVAIPGLLPPVVEERCVLVDGGLMNNFPCDIMAKLKMGPIVGVDVAGDENFSSVDDDIEGRTWWRLARDQWKGRGAPSIVSILMRSGTVGNEGQRREARAMCDLLLEPELPGVYLRSWKAFDRAVEEGYQYAVQMIEQDGLNFLWAVKGAG